MKAREGAETSLSLGCRALPRARAFSAQAFGGAEGWKHRGPRGHHSRALEQRLRATSGEVGAWSEHEHASMHMHDKASRRFSRAFSRGEGGVGGRLLSSLLSSLLSGPLGEMKLTPLSSSLSLPFAPSSFSKSRKKTRS